MAANDTTTERPPLTDEECAGIRARLAAATPGNWLWGDYSEDGYPRVWVSGTRDGVADCFRDEDAEFIAYAPEDVRALLAENQRLRDTIQAVFVGLSADDRIDRLAAMTRLRDGCGCSGGVR